MFKEDGDKAKEKKVVLVPDLPDFKHFATKPHQGPDQHVNQPSESERQRKKREIVKKVCNLFTIKDIRSHKQIIFRHISQRH